MQHVLTGRCFLGTQLRSNGGCKFALPWKIYSHTPAYHDGCGGRGGEKRVHSADKAHTCAQGGKGEGLPRLWGHKTPTVQFMLLAASRQTPCCCSCHTLNTHLINTLGVLCTLAVAALVSTRRQLAVTTRRSGLLSGIIIIITSCAACGLVQGPVCLYRVCFFGGKGIVCVFLGGKGHQASKASKQSSKRPPGRPRAKCPPSPLPCSRAASQPASPPASHPLQGPRRTLPPCHAAQPRWGGGQPGCRNCGAVEHMHHIIPSTHHRPPSCQRRR